MGSNSSHNSTLFYNDNNNHLFSCIITLYILIFLYSPNSFPKLIISPILISTLILLLFILRLGTSQQTQKHVNPKPNLKETFPELKLETKPCCKDSFIEWGMWGPLEVIHEAYEGEDGDEETLNNPYLHDHNIKSRYYPESSSGSSLSSSSSSCSLDGEFEDMFEIILDCGFGYKSGNVVKKLSKEVEVVVVDDEEDNLIEIDISPSKKECEFSW